MRCEIAELELSARLDEEADPRADRLLADHLATCARCRAFEARIARIHEVARVQPAGPVPDLVPGIMREVRRGRRARRVVGLPMPRQKPGWGRHAAAFVAGAVAAALVLGGLPVIRRGPPPALASEIPRRVAEASRQVTAYRATFRIEERNFHRRVPTRVFTATVTFRAPETFRAEVSDDSRYPAGAWPRNDLVLVVDGTRWMAEGPVSCPREALPVCPLEGRERREVRGREPFDHHAPPPTDVVVPVKTLAGSDRVRVVGEGSVLGRETVAVELPYRDAAPLFEYLQAAGSWRPFYALDPVRVSLDAETWFPLAYEVWPDDTPERRLWAVRNGLPGERAGAPVFVAEAQSFSDSVPPGWEPRADGGTGGARSDAAAAGAALDRGFREVPFGALTRSGLALPTDTEGLQPYRAGTFASGGGRPRDEVLVSYASGLTWLKIRQTRDWRRSELFGNVGALAAPVRLPGGGTAYYEPATSSLGRRISIHGAGIDLYVETNLSREDLLRVAGSLPIEGERVPRKWLVRRWAGGVVREQIPVRRAAAEAPYLLLPRELPGGYEPWVAQLARRGTGTAVSVYFRRLGTEPGGVGILLHQSPDTPLPPPMDPDVLAVRVRGTLGRYSPTRGELEWVEDGVYRSLGGSALDLAGLLRVADSLEVPRGRAP